MKQYNELVQHVIDNGTRKPNRTGVDTISTFNYNYIYDMNNGFPLLTNKYVNWKNIVIENLWFLSGSTNIQFLKKHNCKFWDHWADSETLDVPSAYGNFWRDFNRLDQIHFILNELKKNPMSRRMVVSAWNPYNTVYSKLPPCHYTWLVNVQYDVDGEMELNLHMTQRSCDIALGVPYNIAGYAFILSILSHLSGIKVGKFAHTLVDAHIYTSKEDGSMSEYDHIPGLEEQISRPLYDPPTLEIHPSVESFTDIMEIIKVCSTDEILELFKLKNYQYYPEIKFKVAV